MEDRSTRLAPRLGSQRGAVSVTAILLVAGAAALIYAVLGVTVKKSDSYGDVPIPSRSTAELPGGEVDLSLAIPAGAALPQVPPPDLRISVRRPGGDPLRVDSRGGDAEEEDGYSVRRVAAVFPPDEGSYEVEVTSNAAAAAGGRLRIGEGATGAIGARFERIGDLITGPFGILGLVLVALALLWPSFQRALRAQR